MDDLASHPEPHTHERARWVDAVGEIDTTLMALVTTRSTEAIAEIYRRHSSAVYTLAVRVLGDRHLAEDVCHDVFIGLWQSPAGFDPLRGKLRTLLLTRTHGRCVDLVRSRNARSAREARITSEPAAVVPVDQGLLDRSEGELVRAAVNRLPADQLTVLRLAYFGAHTYREVARMLDLPEGTVKARMRAALRSLRADLSLELSVDDGVGGMIARSAG
jgi:RNA polymerase sigma-70 factor, ECF subfamily